MQPEMCDDTAACVGHKCKIAQAEPNGVDNKHKHFLYNFELSEFSFCV